MTKLIILSNMFPDSEFIRSELNFIRIPIDTIIYFPKALGEYAELPNSLDFKQNIIIYPIDDYWKIFKRYNIFKKTLTVLNCFMFIETYIGLKDAIVKAFHRGVGFSSKLKSLFGNVLQVLSYTIQGLNYSKDIVQELINNGFDKETNIIFYSYRLHYHSFAAILIKKKFPNSKLISRAHGYDLYEERHENHFLPYRKFTLAKLNQVHCISEHGRKYLLNNYPMYTPRFEVSRLGVLDNGIAIWSKSKTLRILSCSRLAKEKRIDLMLEVFESLEIPVKWVHIGPGSDLTNLQVHAKKLSTENKSFVFLGYLSNEDINNYYISNPIDIFVNLSQFEGIPVTMMESISYGIPVLGTDVGGVKEIVKNLYNGVLLTENPSIQDVKNAIEEFYYLNESEILSIRKNARINFEEYFEASKNYSEFWQKLER